MEPLHPVDVQDAVPKHLGDRLPTHLLDHQSKQQIVGVRGEVGNDRPSAIGGDQLQEVGRRPHPQQIGRQPVVNRRVVVDAAALAKQIADRCSVRVEIEVRR